MHYNCMQGILHLSSNILATSSELNGAVALLEQYKAGSVPANVTEEELWSARKRNKSIAFS